MQLFAVLFIASFAILDGGLEEPELFEC